MTAVQRIAALTDPVGVLSIYVDADPALRPGSAWQAPVRTGLRALVKEARRSRPRKEWTALEARLEQLEPELENLLDPRLGARGRALFAAVDRDDVHRVELRTPVASLVTLGSEANVVPLLAVAQDGSPAGVAIASWERVELAEWEVDVLRPLETVELAEAVQPRGSRVTNPSVPQSFPERDRYEGAVEARILARVRDAGRQLASTAGKRDWDVLVVDGDPRLVEALSEGLGGGSPFRVVRSPHPLAGPPDAVERVGAAVREVRSKREAELLRELDTSPASTRDPLVLERSLDEGRVLHLLLAVPAERSETLLRRALATGAAVTAVSPGADLGPGGAAALLRW